MVWEKVNRKVQEEPQREAAANILNSFIQKKKKKTTKKNVNV